VDGIFGSPRHALEGRFMPQCSRSQGSSGGEEVHVVRWPAEMADLNRYRRLGVLRLLVIESGTTAPILTDVREDWIRSPVNKADFAIRVAALRARAAVHQVPVLDQDGLLRYGSQVAPMSPTETDLVQPLVERFGDLVAREELIALLSARRGSASQNALDLHVMRIRRRVVSLGLSVRTACGRGYLLEASG
jgi:hypothetical protein